MDGLYQDLIIMAIIFVTGVWCINAYYQLKGKFDELVTDFHRLAEGRDYVDDIDQQAYAQGREWAGVDIRKMQEDIRVIEKAKDSTEIAINLLKSTSNDMFKMQEDIIDLQQKCTNLNAKIKNNDIVSAMSRISVQDILSNENE